MLWEALALLEVMSSSESLLRASRLHGVVKRAFCANFLMQSTVRTISPRVFVGNLIVDMHWRAF